MKITTKTYPSGKIYRYCVDGREVRKCEIETLACNTDEVIEIDYFTAKNFPLIEKPNTDMKVVFTGYCGGQKLMTKAAAVQFGAQIGRLQSRNVYYVTDETKAAETVTEADGCDESAFDLLPTVDELNDCRSDIEKEFDEFDAKYTDRDARFNHGERHAAKLEKKLRELDPTVEVTYDINEDGKDVFYLRFGKYVYRAPFATLDAVEDTFRLWSEDDDMQHADSDLTDAELEAYTDKLREALTVNGNIACVELEESVITIYGDLGGDKDTVAKIVTEMCKRGCWVEYPEDEGDANEKARLG